MKSANITLKSLMAKKEAVLNAKKDRKTAKVYVKRSRQRADGGPLLDNVPKMVYTYTNGKKYTETFAGSEDGAPTEYTYYDYSAYGERFARAAQTTIIPSAMQDTTMTASQDYTI